MRFLLDTSVFIFLAEEERKLITPRVIKLFEDKANQFYLSSVSLWEITLKHNLGKLPFNYRTIESIRQLCDESTIELLPFSEHAAMEQLHIPFLHRDPFDRMLICQARAHELVFVTPDKTLSRYPVPILWE